MTVIRAEVRPREVAELAGASKRAIEKTIEEKALSVQQGVPARPPIREGGSCASAARAGERRLCRVNPPPRRCAAVAVGLAEDLPAGSNGRVLPIDHAIAERWGDLMAPGSPSRSCAVGHGWVLCGDRLFS
jgi:hypothetical protein